MLPVAIVLDLPEALCHERNAARPDRSFGPHVVRRQSRDLRRSLRGLEREGFRHVYVLSLGRGGRRGHVERQPLWNDRGDEHGPFDIIGDVHGCCDELDALLDRARLRARAEPTTARCAQPPGRPPGSSSSATSSTAARTPPACCGW